MRNINICILAPLRSSLYLGGCAPKSSFASLPHPSCRRLRRDSSFCWSLRQIAWILRSHHCCPLRRLSAVGHHGQRQAQRRFLASGVLPPYQAFLADSGPLGMALDDVKSDVGVVDGDGGSVAGFGGGFVGFGGDVGVEAETCSEGHEHFRFGLCSPAWSMIRGQ